MVRVLLTGSDGYIGSVLGPYLARAGHRVVGLDTGYYRAGLLYESGDDHLPTLTRDTRMVGTPDLAGFDAVVHLAELSNDPLGAHRPAVTFAINHRGTMALAQAAKAAGVGRFVYSSSCSVYGIGGDDVKTETSPAEPQTAYAECKLFCEAGLAALNSGTFVTTCLRNATAFGASPRMRFDVVLNNLAGSAWTTGRIAMTSDGTPWRPLVHVLDICKAVAMTLEAPAEAVGGQVFNVGDDSQNYRVREIAEIVAAGFPGCVTSFGPPDADNRSYRVSFARIRRHLPEYHCEWPAERGVEQLARLFAWLDMRHETFTATPFTRLAQLKRLAETRQIDEDFFWTDRSPASRTPAVGAMA
jgi:nucleoside-diphosphate-sugar epimerase